MCQGVGGLGGWRAGWDQKRKRLLTEFVDVRHFFGRPQFDFPEPKQLKK